MAAPGDLADAVGIFFVAIRHEKRCLGTVGVQNVQKPLRIGGRAVVKREIDRPRVRHNRFGAVRRRDDHAAGNGRSQSLAVRYGIDNAPLAGVECVHIRGADKPRGDIAVAVIESRAAGVLVSARLGRVKKRIVADEREHRRPVLLRCRRRCRRFHRRRRLLRPSRGRFFKVYII